MRDSLFHRLREKILGQDEVLSEISALLDRAMLGMRYPGKPIASILALGPTGVGKTDSALIACDALFGGTGTLARFDMSEFMTESSLENLIGGKHRGLFEVRYEATNGKGMLLFDEIEKAHPLILDILLQVLSAGRVTLAGGRTLDLSNYVVFATSNIGARMLMESKTHDRNLIKERTISAAIQELRPEIFGRFDLVAAYNKLSEDVTLKIAELHCRECLKIFRELGHLITLRVEVIDFIKRSGYSERFGARPIRNEAMRIIGESVLDQMRNTGETTLKGTIAYSVTNSTCYMV